MTEEEWRAASERRPRTEAEWYTATDPMPMLEYLRYRGRDRQQRLLGCTACRRVWDLINDMRCRQAVEASEQYADGEISYGELDKYYGEAQEAFEEFSWGDGETNDGVVAHAMSCASSPDLSIDLLSDVLRDVAAVSVIGPVAEREMQSSLIRDIFGNPFRPASILPEWRTSTVLALATGIYEEKAFERMPILADALQDVGCDNTDILNHCRQSGVHTRGCWILDLLLGKE